MDGLISWMRVHLIEWITPPKTIQVIDVIQVILIAYFVYHLIIWVRDTRAYSLLRGILLIIVFIIVANVLGMEVIVWLVTNLGVAAFTALIIIFQPELRKGLERMGHRGMLASIFQGRSSGDNNRFSDHTLNEIVRACFDMGEVRTGALIVIERNVRLEEFVQTGIPIDAIVSGQLLINIFEKNTPLHDGAVIVRGNRVTAATCYLPLSDSMELSKSLGTRHRAGVGISEISDSCTIIVSEETGKVSYAVEGVLHTDVTPAELKERLHEIQKLVNIRGREKGRNAKKNTENNQK
ncbi:MAG: diadenylate cyclase CdaA [Lachnospiraceae bacterium]|nr:diadenylate cyclase CdaA [Lachnospiraceae bacterium]MCI1328539.1 diadenylate cyclase CdaA [Lachnospiraceae bacterium]